MAESGIQIKFFIGALENGELLTHLSQSAAWKEACLIADQGITRTPFGDAAYIGYWIEQASIPVLEAKALEKKLRQQLHLYCPKLNAEKLNISLFSQLFVA